jgi:hypothetical protein
VAVAGLGCRLLGLRSVGESVSRYPSPDEFEPLPAYTWDERPDSVPFCVEEARTALYLEHGRIGAAAKRLRIAPRRLKREIKRSGRLQLLLARLAGRRD